MATRQHMRPVRHFILVLIAYWSVKARIFARADSTQTVYKIVASRTTVECAKSCAKELKCQAFIFYPVDGSCSLATLATIYIYTLTDPPSPQPFYRRTSISPAPSSSSVKFYSFVDSKSDNINASDRNNLNSTDNVNYEESTDSSGDAEVKTDGDRYIHTTEGIAPLSQAANFDYHSTPSAIPATGSPTTHDNLQNECQNGEYVSAINSCVSFHFKPDSLTDFKNASQVCLTNRGSLVEETNLLAFHALRNLILGNWTLNQHDWHLGLIWFSDDRVWRWMCSRQIVSERGFWYGNEAPFLPLEYFSFTPSNGFIVPTYCGTMDHTRSHFAYYDRCDSVIKRAFICWYWSSSY